MTVNAAHPNGKPVRRPVVKRAVAWRMPTSSYVLARLQPKPPAVGPVGFTRLGEATKA